jgi:hypothetical protein
VVELACPTDEGPRRLTALRRKMAAYQSNGARLGWLLIADERGVEVWTTSAHHLHEHALRPTHGDSVQPVQNSRQVKRKTPLATCSEG